MSVNDGAHPVLSKIPLIISPSLRPPQAVTLPMEYKRLNGLPPPSDYSGTLDQIISDAEQFKSIARERLDVRVGAYDKWKKDTEVREIEEKRKIAPGYLDSTHKILQPKRTNTAPNSYSNSASVSPPPPASASANASTSSISELDYVFGKTTLG
ncbi:hypothetical protein TRVA0_006S00914 [Trichomonascus vanleenenianus]|uniref:uncharacterized protein n=1 Tax=Trichomonascus vanleenenianus TaxID=2268995 RepID=UPI003ECB3AD0